jgi:hypothetical protein
MDQNTMKEVVSVVEPQAKRPYWKILDVKRWVNSYLGKHPELINSVNPAWLCDYSRYLYYAGMGTNDIFNHFEMLLRNDLLAKVAEAYSKEAP